MDACRRTDMYSLVMLVLAVTAAAVDFVVRDGDKATLSCGNARGYCQQFYWLFSDTSQSPVVLLVEEGKVCPNCVADPGRLSVRSDCSLEIMNVTVKDVGQYGCRQHETNREYVNIQLSVVTLTRHGKNQLSCSVSSQHYCVYSVKWLLNGQHYPENETRPDRTNSRNNICTVIFSPPTRGRKPNGEDLFTCEVKDYSGDVKLFNLSRQLEGSDAPKKTPKPTTSTVTDYRPNTGGAPLRPVPGGWWWYVVAALGSLALIIILVAIITWKRAKGNRKRLDGNTGQKSGPKDAQHMAEPGDGVCYTCIIYTNTSSKARPPQKGTNAGNGGDTAIYSTVTYITVKVSSSARTPDELSIFHANCSKPDS